jgi:hypothetical protein
MNLQELYKLHPLHQTGIKNHIVLKNSNLAQSLPNNVHVISLLFFSDCSVSIHVLQYKVNTNRRSSAPQKSRRLNMKTITKTNISVKLLSGTLFIVLVNPMVTEAGRGHHHHHHGHHHNYHKHHHHGHNHYYQRNIYYGQPYYPPVPPADVYYNPTILSTCTCYGVAPGYLFMGINTGNVGVMLGF